MYACMYERCMCVCMYVHVCMHVCVCVSMYIYLFICIFRETVTERASEKEGERGFVEWVREQCKNMCSLTYPYVPTNTSTTCLSACIHTHKHKYTPQATIFTQLCVCVGVSLCVGVFVCVSVCVYACVSVCVHTYIPRQHTSRSNTWLYSLCQKTKMWS